jgi:chemotaxis protein CheY-P-specific phosphatase CheC
MVYSHEDSNIMGSSTNKLNNEKNKIAMSVVVESITIISGSATTLLLTFLGFKGKFRFDKFKSN